MKEGYVEIIEMGNVTGGTLANITHAQPSPPGTPPGCSKLPTGSTAPTDLTTGNGGLFGGISLINVLAGGDITENATALSSFTSTALWAAAGTILPDLSLVNPKTSAVFNTIGTGGPGGAEVVVTDWGGSAPPGTLPVDPVSAVLMVEDVYNEYVLDPGTKSGTDWVVTFPTKHFYYNTSFNVLKLFQRNFRLLGACDDVGLTIYNREEQSVLGSFSPPPPTITNSLCWEANVHHVQQHERAPVEQLVEHPDELPERLGRPEPDRWRFRRRCTSWSVARRRARAPATGVHDNATVGDVQRPADHRLRRAVLQQRHADGSWRYGCAGVLHRRLRASLPSVHPVTCSRGNTKRRNFGSAFFFEAHPDAGRQR